MRRLSADLHGETGLAAEVKVEASKTRGATRQGDASITQVRGHFRWCPVEAGTDRSDDWKDGGAEGFTELLARHLTRFWPVSIDASPLQRDRGAFIRPFRHPACDLGRLRGFASDHETTSAESNAMTEGSYKAMPW